jgi:hypothetical protein
MKPITKLGLILLIGILPLLAEKLARAQDTDVQYFPETGHTVRGEFLGFYSSADDPALLYGYPITEPMTSRDGLRVQYFQRARFELAPGFTGSPRVQLTAIGMDLYEPGIRQNVFNPSACQYVDGAGFPVCFQFLDYYRTHGGPGQFGIPISPLEFHDGVLVQYFEYARFEWRTGGFNGRVVPTDLGRIYFDALGEDPSELMPVPPADAAINPVLALEVRAFVSKPITRSSGNQTVFVIVRGDDGQALADARGTATIRPTDGAIQTFIFTTDSRGLGQFTFDFHRQPAGDNILIDITVDYQGIRGETKTSFRIWF